MEQDSEYLLLSTINDLTQKKADISQRDLSHAIHLSLGMTNVLIKRLSKRGLVLIQKVSPRKVTYVLSPDGMNELAGKTYRYLKRTIRKVADYKEIIVTITKDARTRGFARVGILGKSDIDFIVEYAASAVGIEYTVYDDDTLIPSDSFIFVSENWSGECAVNKKAVAHIHELLTGEH
jgi:DNA-binding MarR family transcriptional regulator